MRQRIEREMAKDARLAEQDARIKELEENLAILTNLHDYRMVYGADEDYVDNQARAICAVRRMLK